MLFPHHGTMGFRKRQDFMNKSHIFHVTTEANLLSESTEENPCYTYDVIVYFSVRSDDYAGMSADVRATICEDGVIDLSFINDCDKRFPEFVNKIQKMRILGTASRAALEEHEIEEDEEEYGKVVYAVESGAIDEFSVFDFYSSAWKENKNEST